MQVPVTGNKKILQAERHVVGGTVDKKARVLNEIK